ncbi:5849_t:CDS:1 [Ambispora leptoticha]|uniref:5849_t:CDS:1 n=1 Tax=Ambispora leptoticha TaxID=144679 RepID=A0A9N9FJ85_9GLOM|nr:5849_t:CDS:1 [Ambispora leptoticha]
MTFPPVRIPEGENGLKIARGPAVDYKCNGMKPGPVHSQFTSGGLININWKIETPLEGTCFIELSLTGKDTEFSTIGTIENCADTSGDFETKVQLPSDATSEHGTLRFRWVPRLSGATVIDCADVSISSDNTSSQSKRKRNNNKARNLNKRKPILEDSFFKRDLASDSDIESQHNSKRQIPCEICV